jgi:hypothetical protein
MFGSFLQIKIRNLDVSFFSVKCHGRILMHFYSQSETWYYRMETFYAMFSWLYTQTMNGRNVKKSLFEVFFTSFENIPQNLFLQCFCGLWCECNAAPQFPVPSSIIAGLLKLVVRAPGTYALQLRTSTCHTSVVHRATRYFRTWNHKIHSKWFATAVHQRSVDDGPPVFLVRN